MQSLSSPYSFNLLLYQCYGIQNTKDRNIFLSTEINHNSCREFTDFYITKSSAQPVNGNIKRNLEGRVALLANIVTITLKNSCISILNARTFPLPIRLSDNMKTFSALTRNGIEEEPNEATKSSIAPMCFEYSRIEGWSSLLLHKN